MGHLQYLFAAFAVTWAGIFVFLWTLRRDAQRLRGELASLDSATEVAS